MRKKDAPATLVKLVALVARWLGNDDDEDTLGGIITIMEQVKGKGCVDLLQAARSKIGALATIRKYEGWLSNSHTNKETIAAQVQGLGVIKLAMDERTKRMDELTQTVQRLAGECRKLEGRIARKGAELRAKRAAAQKRVKK